MRDKKILNRVYILIYLIYLISLGYFIYKFNLSNVFYTIVCVVGTCILVKLNKRFSKLFNESLVLILVIFILFAGLLGTCYRFYDIINCYDDFLHIWSGFISCSVAYTIFDYFLEIKIYNTKRKIFFMIFLFMFSMGGASLWELMEFFIDKFLGMNCQAGGLVDTMMDTFDCLIGAIIMTLYYFKKVSKVKNE